MIKFLPSYVGSKSRWLQHEELLKFKDRKIVELFCGSSVISANLASSCILNDKDFFIIKILSNFSELIVPEIFTTQDYLKVRQLEDWWKYTYCLQKMSFSGVFRYGKNGYNVPVKKDKEFVQIRPDYEEALSRMVSINPTFFNKSYLDISTSLFENAVVVLDPPYQSTKASYNNNKFDYIEYWEYVKHINSFVETIILFDTKDNIDKNIKIPIQTYQKNIRVNGKHKGNVESMVILNKGVLHGI